MTECAPTPNSVVLTECGPVFLFPLTDFAPTCVDISCASVEQAIRYAAILLDAADDRQEDFDELLIERNRKGHYWVHFAVRPPKEGNRRKAMFIYHRL